MPSKKAYIAAGVIAAGSAAVVTAFAGRRKRSRGKAVDEELAVMIDEVEAKQSPTNDLLGAKPVFDA
jgi:hypothetical protein